jgi:mono/diheme cytochrome c family protein
LEEALAEGISTGHPDMPEFIFEPDQIEAILAYIGSLKGK